MQLERSYGRARGEAVPSSRIQGATEWIYLVKNFIICAQKVLNYSDN